MVNIVFDPQHDVVNLYRLLRRLEKSVQSPEEWDANTMVEGVSGSGSSKVQVRLKAQKDLQMVKYARKLVHNIQDYGLTETSMDSFGHRIEGCGTQELSDVKTRLDRVEGFFKDQVERNSEPLKRPPSILAQLPPPVEPVSLQEQEPSTSEAKEGSSTVDEQLTEHVEPTDNLLLSPPDWEGIPSAALVSATESDPFSSHRPSFSPPSSLGQRSTATSSAVPLHASGSFTGPTPRRPYQSQAHTSLHEELSSQLESMAAQLKRNAIHFSTNLAKDKAVVDEAAEKLEQNFGVMQKEKGRLSLLSKKTGGTTWMTLGIVLAVVLIFVAMIGVIRFSRK